MSWECISTLHNNMLKSLQSAKLYHNLRKLEINEIASIYVHAIFLAETKRSHSGRMDHTVPVTRKWTPNSQYFKKLLNYQSRIFCMQHAEFHQKTIRKQKVQGTTIWIKTKPLIEDEILLQAILTKVCSSWRKMFLLFWYINLMIYEKK